MESGNYEWERLASFPGAESQHRRSVMNNFSNQFFNSVYYLFKIEFRIAWYEPISTDDAVYFVAGYDIGSLTHIHKFHDNQWTTEIGNLQHARYDAAVYQIGNNFLVAGGAIAGA